jgi:hypothetical protein
LIIPMIIQTILLDPSGAVWTDGPRNVSRLDPSRTDQVDAEHPARNRKVVGSNPTSGSITAGQSTCKVTLSRVLLASLIIRIEIAGVLVSAPGWRGGHDRRRCTQQADEQLDGVTSLLGGGAQHARQDLPAVGARPGAVDTNRPAAIGTTVAVFVLGVLAATGWALAGTLRHAQLRDGLVDRRGVAAILGFVGLTVGITLGLAFTLQATGVSYPATLAAVVGGLGMGIGGPILMRRLRRIMLANRAGSPR